MYSYKFICISESEEGYDQYEFILGMNPDEVKSQYLAYKGEYKWVYVEEDNFGEYVMGSLPW